MSCDNNQLLQVKKSSVGAGGDAGMKRGRGRPRKNPEPDNVTDDEEEEVEYIYRIKQKPQE